MRCIGDFGSAEYRRTSWAACENSKRRRSKNGCRWEKHMNVNNGKNEHDS